MNHWQAIVCILTWAGSSLYVIRKARRAALEIIETWANTKAGRKRDS